MKSIWKGLCPPLQRPVVISDDLGISPPPLLSHYIMRSQSQFFLPNKLSQNIWKSISYKSACHACHACRLLHLRLFRNPVRMHLCVALEVWYSSYMLQFQGHCTFCVSWHWQGWRKEDHYSRPVECVLCVQKGGWGTIVITVDNHCHCTKMHQNCFLLRCTALVLWCGTSDEKLLVWSCGTLVMFASKCYL